MYCLAPPSSLVTMKSTPYPRNTVIPVILVVNITVTYHKKMCGFDRSNRSQIFFKIGALKKFAIFTGKHLCWSLFLIKLQA